MRIMYSCPAGPQGWVNSTISSHSYYSYTAGKMAALDANDINIPVVTYATDKTVITQLNATHLLTRIFYVETDQVLTRAMCLPA